MTIQLEPFVLAPGTRVRGHLGEDSEDDSAIAIPLTAIRGVADPALEATTPPPRTGPWRPAEDESPPPGHLSCPCGSGKKFRNCCRGVASN